MKLLRTAAAQANPGVVVMGGILYRPAGDHPVERTTPIVSVSQPGTAGARSAFHQYDVISRTWSGLDPPETLARELLSE